jgi:hypothetical protein
MKRVILSIAAATTLAAVTPSAATAQYQGTRSQRADNADERSDLRERMADMDARIGAAQASGAITRTRASELRRQVVKARQSFTRSTRGQGFVSAAESASYNRTLDAIDAQLPDQQ